MDINGIGAFVSGGASGLGEATTRALVERGARVAIADVNDDKANALAAELGDSAIAVHCDVTSEAETEAAVAAAVDAFGELRLAVGCAGVGWAEKTVSKRGAHQLLPFETVVRVNLIGMFNVLRLTAAAMNDNEPGEDGERGAIVMTASVAAFDGQIGQISYSASKAGIAGMTLPAARDLSGRGIRVCTIAPGLFDTPLLAALPEPARVALGAGVPFPPRLGMPAEYAQLAMSIAENRMLNGETIRLDGALRMPPK
ncbi:MAG TPA: SDR family NAD(P)-dependent oxidoreductase [Thermoleophilaceae bacterium]|nr:SDR family NAD(P)-dependent oxidoreductase [Thermoleophilaceae bacterium]